MARETILRCRLNATRERIAQFLDDDPTGGIGHEILTDYPRVEVTFVRHRGDRHRPYGDDIKRWLALRKRDMPLSYSTFLWKDWDDGTPVWYWKIYGVIYEGVDWEREINGGHVSLSVAGAADTDGLDFVPPKWREWGKAAPTPIRNPTNVEIVADWPALRPYWVHIAGQLREEFGYFEPHKRIVTADAREGIVWAEETVGGGEIIVGRIAPGYKLAASIHKGVQEEPRPVPEGLASPPAKDGAHPQRSEKRGYGHRRATLDKIERLMEDVRKTAKRNRVRPTRKRAYGQVNIDYKSVRKYVPSIHEKWDDWNSGWEDNWRQMVGWEALEREAN